MWKLGSIIYYGWWRRGFRRLRWAIAHKFSADSSFSKILKIEIQIGRTGALTPVAKIKPVNIGGVVVSNATLHNEEEIIRKDIRIGDTVKIERAGDVIPHVIEVDFKKRKNSSKKFVFPQNCPSCGSKTVKEFNVVTKKKMLYVDVQVRVMNVKKLQLRKSSILYLRMRLILMDLEKRL